MSNYKQLISRSQQEIDAEMIDFTVDSARNEMQQGILSVKSQVLSAEKQLKGYKSAVAKAEIALQTARSKNPFSVQSLLDARRSLLQANESVEEQQRVVNQYKEALDFLISEEKALFGE